MTVSSIFGTLARAFVTLPKVNADAAAAKIAQVQSGLTTVEAVVQALPESAGRKEALAALQEAAIVAGKAIVVAHIVEAAEAIASENASKSAG